MNRRILHIFTAVLALVAGLVGADILVMPTARAQQQETAATAATDAGATDMEARMIRLEQRIADMQTVIGTLQSFVQDSGAATPAGALPPAGGASGGAPSELNIRIIALETQIKALTEQVRQLSEGSSGAPGVPPQGAAPAFPSAQSPAQPPQGPTFGQPAPPQGGAQFGAAQQPQPSPNPFAPRPPQAAAPAATPSIASLAPTGSGPRAIYDASYQNFLRNEFEAAESGFRKFVGTYPDDQLVTNAYYWLGRSLFGRKQYEPAAKAFLAGYKKDKKSAVAPDSLLHLGMSLAALGEKDAACSTLAAIPRQYPDASAQLKQDATGVMRKSGC